MCKSVQKAIKRIIVRPRRRSFVTRQKSIAPKPFPRSTRFSSSPVILNSFKTLLTVLLVLGAARYERQDLPGAS